jgi:hypothetical protein
MPYAGRSVRSIQAKPVSAPIVRLQHPLSQYDASAGGVRRATCISGSPTRLIRSGEPSTP